MRVTLRKLLFVGVFALLPLAASPPANAAMIISFDDIKLTGGTVTGPNGANLGGDIGTDIKFDLITLVDTTSGIVDSVQCGASLAAADPCLLNFNTTTQTLTIDAPGGVYDAGADNTPFTADDGGVVIAGPVNLVTGTSMTFWVKSVGGMHIEGTDIKNPDLLDYFHLLASSFRFVSTDITLVGTSVSDADFDNTENLQLIPEPGMLTLFGIGLFGVARRFAGRRA